MAKKRPSVPASKAKKKVSVKKIAAQIDKAIVDLQAKPGVQPSTEIERARKALVAAREAVESACSLGFFLPSD
jgi:hypothetical protein